MFVPVKVGYISKVWDLIFIVLQILILWVQL